MNHESQSSQAGSTDEAGGRLDRGEYLVEVWRRELPPLTWYIFQRLRNMDDAQELAQEAIVRLIGRPQTASVGSSGAYLTRIAQNLIRDRAKRGSTKLARISVPLDKAWDNTVRSPDDPHRSVEWREALVRWQRILAELPPEALDVLVRNRVSGESYMEIAAEKNIPLWKVQKLMVRGMKLVREALDADESDHAAANRA